MTGLPAGGGAVLGDPGNGGTSRNLKINILNKSNRMRKVSGDDEMLEYFTNLFRDIDLFVFGRKTYELMVPFWPDVAKNRSGKTKAVNEFAQAFDAVDKILVFSQSLDRAEGKNTRIVRTSPQDEILKLKQGQGKEISIGGLNLLSQLVETGSH
jgi:dihydrofolate reductase